MAKIRITCPQCSAQYTIDEIHVGKRGECKKCNTKFVLKAAGARESHDHGRTRALTEFKQKVWASSPQSNCAVCGKKVRGPSGMQLVGSGKEYVEAMLEGIGYACAKCGFIGCFACCADVSTTKVVCKNCGNPMSQWDGRAPDAATPEVTPRVTPDHLLVLADRAPTVGAEAYLKRVVPELVPNQDTVASLQVSQSYQDPYYIGTAAEMTARMHGFEPDLDKLTYKTFSTADGVNATAVSIYRISQGRQREQPVPDSDSGPPACGNCSKPFGIVPSLGFAAGGYECEACGARFCMKCGHDAAKAAGRATMLCPGCGSDRTKSFRL